MCQQSCCLATAMAVAPRWPKTRSAFACSTWLRHDGTKSTWLPIIWRPFSSSSGSDGTFVEHPLKQPSFCCSSSSAEPVCAGMPAAVDEIPADENGPIHSEAFLEPGSLADEAYVNLFGDEPFPET
ncbi:unnamed protein product [Polarella glacialis]|uniref:Uncharacterized protein n=1 Tax=Polarella glacialis TaxID=89957 RepID=A0A813H9R7_POLGL|nr:unnamed protein product [Polarella glacialis]